MQTLIFRCPSGRHFLIQGKYVRLRTDWRDRMRVDLSVALRVVIPDMREFRSALKSVVIPITMSHPTANHQFKPT